MGKGLGIDPTGTNVAFLAGTGVLVFIDFVAYIMRANLGLLEKDEMPVGMFDKASLFKFVLYASFDNRRDAFALELLEGLYEIT